MYPWMLLCNMIEGVLYGCHRGVTLLEMSPSSSRSFGSLALPVGFPTAQRLTTLGTRSSSVFRIHMDVRDLHHTQLIVDIFRNDIHSQCWCIVRYFVRDVNGPVEVPGPFAGTRHTQ